MPAVRRFAIEQAGACFYLLVGRQAHVLGYVATRHSQNGEAVGFPSEQAARDFARSWYDATDEDFADNPNVA